MSLDSKNVADIQLKASADLKIHWTADILHVRSAYKCAGWNGAKRSQKLDEFG